MLEQTAFETTTNQENPKQTLRLWLVQPVLRWVQHNFTLAIFLLALLVLAEVLWGMQVLRNLQEKSSAKNQVATTVPNASAVPSLVMTSSSNHLKVGETVTTTLTLDTAGNNTDAATAVITYNPSVLEYVKVENGPIYKEYLAPKVDQKLGHITVTGLATETTYFKGKGIFASLTFKAKGKGETIIDFDFKPKAADKTALAAAGKQILGFVRGVSIAVK